MKNLLICGFRTSEISSKIMDFLDAKEIDGVSITFSDAPQIICTRPFDVIFCAQDWADRNSVVALVEKAKKKAKKVGRNFIIHFIPEFNITENMFTS